MCIWSFSFLIKQIFALGFYWILQSGSQGEPAKTWVLLFGLLVPDFLFFFTSLVVAHLQILKTLVSLWPSSTFFATFIFLMKMKLNNNSLCSFIVKLLVYSNTIYIYNRIPYIFLLFHRMHNHLLNRGELALREEKDFYQVVGYFAS